jgi:glycosyltransferase involved in cell wall biosynthesis
MCHLAQNFLPQFCFCDAVVRYLQRTIESIAQESSAEHLLEIIVVDDASHPPLTLHPFQKQDCGGPESTIDCKIQPPDFGGIAVHVLRLDQRQGLIRSKNIGARVAAGDASYTPIDVYSHLTRTKYQAT